MILSPLVRGEELGKHDSVFQRVTFPITFGEHNISRSRRRPRNGQCLLVFISEVSPTRRRRPPSQSCRNRTRCRAEQPCCPAPLSARSDVRSTRVQRQNPPRSVLCQSAGRRSVLQNQSQAESRCPESFPSARIASARWRGPNPQSRNSSGKRSNTNCPMHSASVPTKVSAGSAESS